MRFGSQVSLDEVSDEIRDRYRQALYECSLSRRLLNKLQRRKVKWKAIVKRRKGS